MQCYSQQYAFEILKEYPLEKWVKYRMVYTYYFITR